MRPVAARALSALLVAALLAPDLARAEVPAPPIVPIPSPPPAPSAPPPDPAAKARPAPDVKETHTNGDLARYQVAIDTDKIGKDYASYFEGLVATQCPSVIAEKKKGILVYFKNKTSGAIFTIVVRCENEWSGQFASTEEVLKPLDPAEQPACIGSGQDLKMFQQAVKLASDGGQAALAAASKCATDKEDAELDPASCGASLAKSLGGFKSGIARAITGKPNLEPGDPSVMQQGCAETLTKVFIKNFASSGEFVVDAAGAAWNGTKWAAKEAGEGAVAGGEWVKKKIAEKVWGQDNETSDAALNASSQPDSILKKIKSVNPADVWQGFVTWAGNVISGFKTIFTDELGCQVWSGVPMESTCLSPLSLKCVSCGQVANLICGTIGFLGSEFIMSAMTGFALGATARVAELAKGAIKARMATGANKLNDLQEMLKSVKAKDPALATAANARGAADLANKYASAMMSSVTSQLSSLNLAQSMDGVLSGYPGMRLARQIHYGALGKGRKTADEWIARLSGDGTVLDEVASASKFDQLEASFKKISARVATEVRLSRTGRLTEEQITQIDESFRKAYIDKVQDALGPKVKVTLNEDGNMEIIDKAKVAADGTYDTKAAFVYRPGINHDNLAGLSAKDSAASIAKQLEDVDGFVGLKAQLIAKEMLPDNFPESLRDGFNYSALKDTPGNSLQRFSSAEGARQWGRMEIQKKLDSSLGVNRDSQFLVISAEIF